MHTLDRLPRTLVRLLVAGLLASITALDWVVGADVSLAVLYLAPVALAVWCLGGWHGGAVAVGAAALWSTVQVLAPASGHPLAPAWEFASSIASFLLAAFALSAARRAFDRERTLARTDPLTGLANRHAFVERATLDLARARRAGGPITLAYLDVDDFKALNDQAGHAAGDAVLIAVGAALRAGVRATDCAARLGGDEFAILLPDLSAETAVPTVTRLHDALTARVRPYGAGVSFSIGCVTFTLAPPDVDGLLRVADACMYAVKREGKGRVRFESAPTA